MIDRKQLERLAYQHTHRDFKGKVDGVPYVLKLINGGTASVPVSSLTDTELLAKLPSAVRATVGVAR